MPRPSKGARLYLRKDGDGRKRWIIRDRMGDTRTGFLEAERGKADELFRAYLAGQFKPKRGAPTGFIYFVTCLSSDNYPIKIGWTFTPMDTRMRQLQGGNPNLLTVVATLVGTQEDERKLHLYFAHYHVRGEWFLRGADLLEYIGGLPGQVETFGADEFDREEPVSVQRPAITVRSQTESEHNAGETGYKDE